MDIFELPDGKREAVLEKLSYFLKNDEETIKLAVDLLFIGHLWDDLIDRDKERSNEDISAAFTKALSEVPVNRHFPAIYHLLRNAINQWKISNELMTGNQDEKLIAFLIRNALMELVHYLMFLVGGASWVDQEGANFWRFLAPGANMKYQEFLGETENA